MKEKIIYSYTFLQLLLLVFILTTFGSAAGFWTGYVFTEKRFEERLENAILHDGGEYFTNNSQKNLGDLKLDIPEDIRNSAKWSDNSFNLYAVYIIPGERVIQMRSTGELIDRDQFIKASEANFKILEHSKIPDSVDTVNRTLDSR